MTDCQHGTPPPILFTDLASSQLPYELTDDVNRLLDLKIHSPAIKLIPRIECINHYLDASIAEIKQKTIQQISAKAKNWDELNTVFISTIKEYI
ncbi:nucleotidyltransferase domain-containing protein [Clostridiaceae bacterium Marseille-Q4149]|nr:nucleotidyltransferase domain-containing protein [Clostridiaceae bacterium Marseille-Q4149]